MLSRKYSILTVMKDSINLDPVDPESNFFLANLYTIKVKLDNSLFKYLYQSFVCNITRVVYKDTESFTNIYPQKF